MNAPEPKPIPYQPLPPLFGAAVLGILADRFTTPPFWFWASAVCAGLMLGFLAHRRGRNTTASLLILAACCALFGLWHHDRWNRFADNDPVYFAREFGEPAALRGVVRDMPRLIPPSPPDPGRVFKTTERTLFTLHATGLRQGDRWIDLSGNVSVVVEGACEEFRVGDTVRVLGSLSRPVGPQNPGDFDYAGMLRGRRILCILRVASPAAVSLVEPGKPGVSRCLETVRRAGRANLRRVMDPATAPLATAMLLGMREGVDEDTTQSLIETGTMHILAISGLHIGLVAAVVAFLLRLFGVSRKATALVLIGTVLVYLFLTDVRPPAIRATVLVCVLSVSMFSGRRAVGTNTLCATALIVLALNPTELFQFGAQLSFIATGAFLWIPRIDSLKRFFYRSPFNDRDDAKLDEIERLEIRHWVLVRLIRRFVFGAVELLLVSLTIWSVSLPLILDRIHLLTPVALAVNPLLWFPLTAALLSGFGAMLFGSVPLLGGAFGFCADGAFGFLFGMIRFFRDLGGHYWVPGPPVWWNVVFYAVFVVLTFLPLRRPSPRRLLLLLTVWVAVGAVAGWIRDIDRRGNDRLTLSVFSVGHGQCMLITTPDKKTIAYDVGCISSPRRAADVLGRALWRLGRTSIDAVVLSHPDNDHYNGVVHLAERFSIGAVCVSPYMFLNDEPSLRQLRDVLREKNIPLKIVADGDDLTEYGLTGSRFFHPPRSDFGEGESSNASSLVLYFRHRGVGVLLTGDLDGRLVSPFLEREPVSCDIVSVPHHGGRSNQTERLLRWATPKLLLISAGRFTHKDEVLEEYRRRGFAVRSTFLEGAIEIPIDEQSAPRFQATATPP